MRDTAVLEQVAEMVRAARLRGDTRNACLGQNGEHTGAGE